MVKGKKNNRTKALIKVILPSGTRQMVSLILNDTADSSDLSKAAITVEDSSVAQQPKFFNYHEYVVTNYRALEEQEAREHGPEYPICVTHFPNIYVPESSEEFKTTRVVRIPRRFESSTEFPSFSTDLPGFEPAALPDPHNRHFVPVGEYQGQLFGDSSVSPLANYISQEEWASIISDINGLLAAAYNPVQFRNFANVVLDYFTLNFWSIVAPYILKHPLQKLEDYVAELNHSDMCKSKGIKIVSPRENSYLSVCIKQKKLQLQY